MNRPSLVPLVKKELRTSLNSASSYLAAIFFLTLGSLWFLRIHNFAARDYASFREFFSIFPLLFIVLIPLLTMKIWADERRGGTIEILFSMPYRMWQLVLGKFLGAFLQFAVIMLLTLPLILILSQLGDFDFGQILIQYVGVLLLGAASISMGQWISALSGNQITAALISISAMLLFILVFDAIAGAMRGFFSDLLRYFSLSSHFNSFARGVLDSRDLSFFILMTMLFLYLNARSLLLKKWS
jgi:ABC-2 type transport system permease protein